MTATEWQCLVLILWLDFILSIFEKWAPDARTEENRAGHENGNERVTRGPGPAVGQTKWQIKANSVCETIDRLFSGHTKSGLHLKYDFGV